MKDITESFPPIQTDAAIEILIGQDLLAVHHVLDQRLGSDDIPYTQKGVFGWVIIGEVCRGKLTDNLS